MKMPQDYGLSRVGDISRYTFREGDMYLDLQNRVLPVGRVIRIEDSGFLLIEW